MDLEVLVVTNKDKLEDIIAQSNYDSDVVIAQQTNKLEYRELNLDKHNKYKLRIVSTNTKGVGLNRNVALAYAKADICLLADDDVIYEDDYRDTILSAFAELPQADVLIFNIDTIGQDMGRRQNSKVKRVRFFNFMNYGAVRIAFRREAILKKNISFTSLFGGGAKFSAGEDISFTKACLDKGLRVYTYPKKIAGVIQEESSWFTGYHEKYFYDKGALLAFNFKGLQKYLYALIFAYKFRTKTELSFSQIYRKIIEGFKEF